MADYDINYDDKRFKAVESEKSAALKEYGKVYDNMISNSDKHYDKQIEASKQWADTQTKLQNEQTNFAIQEIEQQKEQAKKDYIDEQSGAYTDWQRQSNEYGANAEKEAQMGMSNTGYSESSQVSMYNTYQNRVMTARESYNRAIQDFNNGITEARLQNNSALAEIRYKALQQQLEFSLQGFQYKNQLLLDKANQKLTIENNYYNRYQDVLNQINTENAMAEQIRQYNASLAEEQRQFNYYNKLGEFANPSGGSGGGVGSSGSRRTYNSSIKKVPTTSVGSNEYVAKEKSSSNSSNSSSTLPKATAKSVLNLGGPYSASNVAQKVAAGAVESYKNKKNETVFKRSSPTSKLLFSKYRF